MSVRRPNLSPPRGGTLHAPAAGAAVVAETNTRNFTMSRLPCRARRRLALLVGVNVLWLVAGPGPPVRGEELRVASGFQAEVVATAISRPIQLALTSSGLVVVLGHAREGAAELFWLDPADRLPRDGSRLPRVVIPFSPGPRKTVFGSLAVDPRSGDLFLGEENGNRIYRLTVEHHLTPFAVGLYHLVGGSSLAFDGEGRLVLLDYASPETQLRSEAPPPPELEWLAHEAYRGPVVFRIKPDVHRGLPLRMDVLPPLYPRGWGTLTAREPVPRFISVAAAPGGRLLLLDSLGQLWRWSGDTGLDLVTRLPSGHYHRTNIALAPDGSLFVSTGFHIRKLHRVAPTGALTTIAWDLADPEGIVVDASGALYLAESALHRIIRIRPRP